MPIKSTRGGGGWPAGRGLNSFRHTNYYLFETKIAYEQINRQQGAEHGHPHPIEGIIIMFYDYLNYAGAGAGLGAGVAQAGTAGMSVQFIKGSHFAAP